MDLCEILRPLFSYVAHLTASTAVAAGQPVAPDTVRRDLQYLVEAARARLPRDGEDAWFALAAWTAERLAEIPGCAVLADTVLPGLDDWESGFYQRLNRLLHRPENSAAIAVYARCLDLGFRGYYARPGFEHHLDGYRSRCREVLAAGTGRKPAAIRHPAHSRARDLVSAAAMWTAPAVITVLLYALYRLLLSDLYSTILG